MGISEITLKEATRLCARADHALHQNEPLSRADLAILRNALETWALIGDELATGHFSLRRLREIYGLELVTKSNISDPSTTDETNEDASQTAKSSDEPREPKPHKNPVEGGNKNHPGRRDAKDFPEVPVTLHSNADHPSGSACEEPDCKGHVYPFKRGETFRSMLRITGGAPLRAECHEFEDMRCNMCGKVYEAPASDDLTNDGPVGQMYGFSAMATIALYKYLGATPWWRQSRLQKDLGLDVSPSVQWDQCEALANTGRVVVEALKEVAAAARGFYSDDANFPILSEREGQLKKDRRHQKESLRTGMHTSCIIAELMDKRHVVLFKTGVQHSGEWMDEVLARRPVGLAPPFHMADRSSSNLVTVTKVTELACNAHPRNDFEAIKKNFKCACGRMLDRYKKLYKIVRYCDENGLGGRKRLEYLQAHATPIVDEIFHTARTEIESHFVEPNSGLGKLYNYLTNHETELRAFLRYEDVPLDNNLCEAMLGKIVMLRKNAWFYKNEVGAWVSDVIMSLGQTAILSGVNPYEYFVHLLRNAEDVRKHPQEYLPWKYQPSLRVAA